MTSNSYLFPNVISNNFSINEEKTGRNVISYLLQAAIAHF